MSKTFKIIFIQRKPKNYTDGPIPIYARMTIKGKRIEWSTNRECDPEKWNKSTGRVRGNGQSANQINSHLEVLRNNIFEVQRDLMMAGVEVTVNSIKNKIDGKTEHKKSLLDVYRYHVQQVKELVGKQYAAGTLKRFKAALSSLEAFIKWKYNEEDIALTEVNFQFITEYEFYLKSQRNVQHNTAMGIIKKLKQIIRMCLANEWIERDPFMNFKVRIHDTRRNVLMEDELIILSNKLLMTERLDIVRDIFLFSCYTGLSYGDVEKLAPADISTGIDGEKWVFTTRNKTDTDSRIPLLPMALSLIEKYSAHPKTINCDKLFPMLSNQRMNSYLKELADICGIDKELTFHCARHTFATTVTLSNGVPIETVSKMLGHKSLRTTQIYAKILDKKVSEDMSILRNKLAGKKIGSRLDKVVLKKRNPVA